MSTPRLMLIDRLLRRTRLPRTFNYSQPARLVDSLPRSSVAELAAPEPQESDHCWRIPEVEREPLMRARRMRTIMMRLEGMSWAEIVQVEQRSHTALSSAMYDQVAIYRVYRALETLARARQT